MPYYQQPHYHNDLICLNHVLIRPKVSLSPVGNERPGWDSSPSSDMSFITLTLNGGNDEHFNRVITCCVPLMSEGKSGVPSFNI